MLPNFLLVGAAKAGTTSLHRILNQHPDIFMSRIKEPGFFVFEGTGGYAPTFVDRRFVTDLAAYEALFEGAETARIIGESSPYYLEFASPDVVARIKRYLPDVRLLAVLRQPVDQAYSRFVMWRRLERDEGLDFRVKFIADVATLHQYDSAVAGNRRLLRSYADRLRLYVDAFETTQLKIMLYDDFVADPQTFVTEIQRFLGVDTSFRSDLSIKANRAGLHRFTAVSALLNRPNPVRWLARRLLPDGPRELVRDALTHHLTKPAPKLDQGLRAELTELMAGEIDALQQLIGRDLAAWRTTPQPHPVATSAPAPERHSG